LPKNNFVFRQKKWEIFAKKLVSKIYFSTKKMIFFRNDIWNFRTKKIVHPLLYKRTGRQFWSRTGRATIFWCFLGRAIIFKEKHRGKLDGRQNFARKTGRATKCCPKNWTGDKFFLGGRARPKYRPSFYTGGGVSEIFYKNIFSSLRSVLAKRKIFHFPFWNWIFAPFAAAFMTSSMSWKASDLSENGIGKILIFGTEK